MRYADDEEFDEHFAGLCKDSKGTFDCDLIAWKDVPEMAGRPTPDGMICIVCNAATFSRHRLPAALFVLYPFASERNDVVAAMVCVECFKRADLRDRIVARVRESLLPDAQVVSSGMQ
jgi:hypothetical protein